MCLIRISFCISFFLVSIPFSALAQTTPQSKPANEDVQSKIDARSTDIANLEKLINQYQSEINALSNKETSLANTLKELNLTQKKLQASISLTHDKIDAKNSEIRSLTLRILNAQGNISDSKLFVSETMKRMNEQGNYSIPIILLSGSSLTDAWNTMNELATLEGNIEARIQALTKTKTNLETNKKATEKAKVELLNLQNQLNNERKIVIETTNEQKQILADTKNSESAYRKLLLEKQTLKNEFEREVLEFESQLKLAVDISLLPKTGLSILSLPLDNIRITQYFGNTTFASQNTQLYGGKGHNGVDFAASIGTPVKASLSGIVVGTGNTDAIKRCYSLGKWILVKHSNGLSTLYAHLSLQNVSVGSAVSTGQIIGYSGNTGYTTGPHLHFGVYASAGIEIKRFTNSRSSCNNAILPVAVFQAYLNPLSYLPAISI